MKTPRTAIVVSLFLFVFSSAPWQANATPATDAERHLKQAVSQVEAGNWEAAVKAFEAAQSTGAPLPDSFAYHYGRALAKAKRYVEARIVLEGYLANQGAEARFAKPARELLAEIRQQASAQVREQVRAVDAAQAATVKEREAEVDARYRAGEQAQALEGFRPLAEQGSALAQRRLGELYLAGKAVPADPAEGARWLARAAAQNDVPALARLGRMRLYGEDGLLDWSEAQRLLQKAAAGRNAEAMGDLGVMALFGYGQAADPAAALNWYAQAFAAGLPQMAHAAGTVAEYFLRPPNPLEGRQWYERGAAVGDALCMFELARMHGDGRGVAKDGAAEQQWLDRALAAGSGLAYHWMAMSSLAQNAQDVATAESWYTRGSEAGNGESAYQLSVLRLKAQDEAGAVRWLQRGAELKNPNACFALSERHRLGRGVPADAQAEKTYLLCAASAGHGEASYRMAKSLPPARSVPWLERAIRARHAEAINAHAELLLQGEGVPRNPALAAERFKTAAEMGSLAAYVNYARLVEPRDASEAQRWYRAAAERGYAPAQRIYGEILLRQPLGVYRSDGINYLRKAAEGMDVQAAFALGQYYANGEFVGQDAAEARRYFTLARDLGHPEAGPRLQALGP